MSDEINNVVQEAASTIKAAINTPSTGGGGGGGGGFFGGIVSSIGGAINSAADQIGAAVTSVEKVGQKVVSSVNTTVDNIARNPLPTIETAILISAGVDPSLASATVTYANGGSAEDAVKAGVVSYAGQKATEAFSPASSAPDNIDVGGGFNPATGTGDPTTAAAATVPTVEKSAVGGAARGATSAALKGGSASDIITGGVVGGAAGGGGQAASEYAGFDQGSLGSALTKNVIGSSISNYLSPTRSSQTVGGSTAPTPTTSVTTTGAGQSPGSQALSQALRIGDPVLGSGDKEEGKKSGWNVESLRYMGQES